MLDSSSAGSPQFSLAEDQIAVRDMARAFAAEVFAPHALAKQSDELHAEATKFIAAVKA